MPCRLSELQYQSVYGLAEVLQIPRIGNGRARHGPACSLAKFSHGSLLQSEEKHQSIIYTGDKTENICFRLPMDTGKQIVGGVMQQVAVAPLKLKAFWSLDVQRSRQI